MYFICCRILGVKPGSDEETIKAAYRKSAKELHPDINNSDKAQEYFTILQNAYEYLLSHRYSEEELEILWHYHLLKNNTLQNTESAERSSRPVHTERFTLREVLKQSHTARVIYILFHILFLFAGIWLILNSLFIFLFHTPESRTDFFSAYLTLIFGLILGISLTTVFLITGIAYLRDR